MSDIGVEKRGHVALVEIRRPPNNFFDIPLIKDIASAFESFDEDGNIRAVVLAAQGKAFCAGANFGDGSALDAQGRRRDEPGPGVAPLYIEGNRLFRAGDLPGALAAYGSGYDPAHPDPLLAYNLGATAHRLGRQMAAFHADWDVLLTPGLASLPVKLGWIDMMMDDVDEYWRRVFSFSPFTVWFNITGQPAMMLPLGQSASALPVAAQLVGRFGDEATLFRLAAQLEAVRPWFGRKPPIAS